MSKRKLNQQQQHRIRKAQAHWVDALQLPQTSDTTQASTGLVLCRYGQHAQIQTSTHTLVECHLRPNLPTLVAGDRVVWQPVEQSHQGVIVSLMPRTSVLERIDKHGQAKALAANLSQLIIVVAPEPCISWSLLDSYLISAQQLNLKPCIVCNKTDLPSEPLQTTLKQVYESLGYPVILLSRDHSSSYVALRSRLQHQTSILVGQSGVGKSSIIQHLIPDQAIHIETSALSQGKFGQHTTSYARYYPLDSGGALIDSPGVRAFQPPHWSIPNILEGYPELKSWLGQCQFRNCTHIQTPGCAIDEARRTHDISELRYENLLKALQDQKN